MIPTLPPTVTLAPTLTPAPTLAPQQIPTATPPPTPTPFVTPSITPFPTATPEASTPIISGPIPTPTPLNLGPTLTAPPAGEGQPGPGPGVTIVPGDPVTGGAGATAPGPVGPSGPPLPDQEAVIVSYAGQIVPLLTLSGQPAPDAPIQGQVFDVNPATGEIAHVDANRNVSIAGRPMIISPSSEFGPNENVSFRELFWSPNGHRLAIIVDDAGDNTVTDAGVWIYEPVPGDKGLSWQVFRAGTPTNAPQLHEQRTPVGVQWSRDSTRLIIKVYTPRGYTNVITPATNPANNVIVSIPFDEFEDATWADDGVSVIVSGRRNWNEPTVVGKLDENGLVYTEFLNETARGIAAHAAIEYAPGRIAFIGSASPGTLTLYTMDARPGAPPAPAPVTIPGTVQQVEWRADRQAALVTVVSPTNERRLWIVRIDGTAQDVTPPPGAPFAAHWR